MQQIQQEPVEKWELFFVLLFLMGFIGAFVDKPNECFYSRNQQCLCRQRLCSHWDSRNLIPYGSRTSQLKLRTQTCWHQMFWIVLDWNLLPWEYWWCCESQQLCSHLLNPGKQSAATSLDGASWISLTTAINPLLFDLDPETCRRIEVKHEETVYGNVFISINQQYHTLAKFAYFAPWGLRLRRHVFRIGICGNGMWGWHGDWL